MLSGAPARGAVEVAGRLLAIQGQDLRGARLAIRARTQGLTAADVDRALPADGTVVLHMLMLASLRGIAVRGPVIGARHAYVHVREWLGKPPPDLEEGAALAELARRYLAGHGPASDRDLAKWAGLAVGQARRGLAAIGAGLRDRPDGLAELSAGSPAADGWPEPRLLGPYDPVLLGWSCREPVLGPHQQVVTVNGLFRPFALVAGRAAGIWAWSDGQVRLEPFAELPAEVMTALATEARDIQRFLRAGADPACRSS